MGQGKLRTAMAFTEPGGGTDLLGGMRTRARKVDGGWVIDGEKIWSTCAHVADYLFLMARTRTEVDKRSDGISIFFVPRRSPGITITELPKLGMRCVASCAVRLEEVFVPDELLLGEEGRGWRPSTRPLNNERLVNAATCLGMLDGVLRLKKLVMLLMTAISRTRPVPISDVAIYKSSMVARCSAADAAALARDSTRAAITGSRWICETRTARFASGSSRVSRISVTTRGKAGNASSP